MNNLSKLILVLAMVGTIVAGAAETMWSSATTLDTQTPQTTITLQSGKALAYSLNWGATQAASVAILADGLEGTETAEISNKEIFSGTDAGYLNTYAWDYSGTSPQELPKGAYTLSHVTYDGDSATLETTKCSVKLVPEPCCGIVAFLAGLLALGKRR